MSVVVVGSSNAVNLTDGLDGLAIGAVGIAAATYAVLTYVAGNPIVAHYLRVPFVSEAGELSVFCGAIVGALARISLVQLPPGRRVHGRRGVPAARRRHRRSSRSWRSRKSCSTIVGGLFVLEAALGDSPGRLVQADRASGSFEWRRFTITSSSRAGRSRA